MPKSHADSDRGPLGAYSDAARRLSDAITMHLMADPLGNEMRWVAFKLADGECRPEPFESKREAIKATGMFASLYGYAQIHPAGMTPQQAASYIKTCRTVAENPNLRWRQLDHEAPAEALEQIVMPLNRERLR